MHFAKLGDRVSLTCGSDTCLQDDIGIDARGGGMLQHAPTLCTCFQRVAAGDATQMVALGRSILISAP